MKPASIVGILLIVIGIVALAYEGITYTTRERENVVKLGPLKVDAVVEKEHRLPLSPILGVAALACGIVLVIVGGKRVA
jgi:hypothetical protein